eukprot:scaffold56297_cov33-Phaeocystis_antarctica.AAC.1
MHSAMHCKAECVMLRTTRCMTRCTTRCVVWCTVGCATSSHAVHYTMGERVRYGVPLGSQAGCCLVRVRGRGRGRDR